VQLVNNEQFNENDLIEFEVPLNLPYITGTREYERVEGEIQLNGNYYIYVKRKVNNDTLYVKCLPNSAKTKLYRARNMYALQGNDPNEERANNTTVKKCHLNYEYNQPVAEYNIFVIVSSTNHLPTGNLFKLVNPFIEGPYHPPQV
jgi:hypothetical protein